MAKISFIVTNSGTITAVANGKSYTVPSDHTNYKGIKEAIKSDDVDELEKLVNVAKCVADFAAPVGDIVVKDGEVYWKGEVLHNAVTNRIFDLMREGFPIDPLVAFLGNLMNNPSKRAVEELYKFLEHHGLPLTTDGYFLGYKRVRDDYTDNHTGKYDNSVGKVIEMPRNCVDDEWRTACSSGFHVGCIEYVRTFNANTGHVMIVKVNPADVVSVPEHEVTKLRTCRYEVVSEYDRDLVDALPGAVYNSDGTHATVPDVPMGSVVDDDSWIDDEDSEIDEYEDDSELDEDDAEEMGDEAWINHLTQVVNNKGVNAVSLAWHLDIEKHRLSGNPSVEDVIGFALEERDGDDLEKLIREIPV